MRIIPIFISELNFQGKIFAFQFYQLAYLTQIPNFLWEFQIEFLALESEVTSVRSGFDS